LKTEARKLGEQAAMRDRWAKKKRKPARSAKSLCERVLLGEISRKNVCRLLLNKGFSYATVARVLTRLDGRRWTADDIMITDDPARYLREHR
jgi:SOS response regulatory protein OraA/RecX